jgi:hypothetical protein
LRVIPPQRGGKFLAEGDATEELGVALDSVETAIQSRNDSRDHFVLTARQRQVWREEHAEGGQGMAQSLRDKAVGRDDAVRTAIRPPEAGRLLAVLVRIKSVNLLIAAL